MKMKLSEEFTHKLTEAQKEIIEQVTNNLQGEWRKRVLEEETDEEPGALALALAGKVKENDNIESVNVPDPVQEEQTEEENSESDESDIEISNIRYAVSSESEEE